MNCMVNWTTRTQPAALNERRVMFLLSVLVPESVMEEGGLPVRRKYFLICRRAAAGEETEDSNFAGCAVPLCPAGVIAGSDLGGYGHAEREEVK